MINLEQVNWRKDAVTQRFIAEHKAELADPSSMTPDLLADATTYCQGDTNPYAEELARRAGMLEKYRHTSGEKRSEVVCRAAKGFNILLI